MVKFIVVPTPTCKKLKSRRIPLLPLAVKSRGKAHGRCSRRRCRHRCHRIASWPPFRAPLVAVARLKTPLFRLTVPTNPLAEIGFGSPSTLMSKSRCPPRTPARILPEVRIRVQRADEPRCRRIGIRKAIDVQSIGRIHRAADDIDRIKRRAGTLDISDGNFFLNEIVPIGDHGKGVHAGADGGLLAIGQRVGRGVKHAVAVVSIKIDEHTTQRHIARRKAVGLTVANLMPVIEARPAGCGPRGARRWRVASGGSNASAHLSNGFAVLGTD